MIQFLQKKKISTWISLKNCCTCKFRRILFTSFDDKFYFSFRQVDTRTMVIFHNIKEFKDHLIKNWWCQITSFYERFIAWHFTLTNRQVLNCPLVILLRWELKCWLIMCLYLPKKSHPVIQGSTIAQTIWLKPNICSMHSNLWFTGPVKGLQKLWRQ